MYYRTDGGGFAPRGTGVGYDDYYAQLGLPRPPFVPHQLWMREKHDLRRMSIVIGLAMIGYIAFSSVFVFAVRWLIDVLHVTGAIDYDAFVLIWNSSQMQYLVNIIYSVVIVGGPFFIAGAVMKKWGIGAPVPLGKPKSSIAVPVIIVAGFAICLFGNIVTGYLDVIIETLFGVEIEVPVSIDIPHSPGGIALYFVSTAVVPPLIEEFILRGVVMQPLRRYGDSFAVLASALVFGMMHCNFAQIPFAFFAGIAIGYAVILTESLWTGIIIHFLNNGLSVALSVVTEFYGYESREYMVCNVLFYTIIFLGVACIVYFWRNGGQKAIRPSPLVNKKWGGFFRPQPYSARISYGTLFAAFIFTIPMVVALLAVLYESVMAI